MNENNLMSISEEEWEALIAAAPEESELPPVEESPVEEIQRLMILEGYDKIHVNKIESMTGRGLAFADAIANRFLSNEKTMFYVHGIRGTGKTQIAARVGFLMKTGLGGLGKRVLVSEYLKDLKASYSGTVEQKRDMRRLTQRMIKAPLLVLDEFCEIKGSEFNQEELNMIVDKRYGALLPTLIIGNDEPDDAKEILGASIWSRLMEVGGCIQTDWKSFRVKE